MKKCSTSLIIRKMQFKTTVRLIRKLWYIYRMEYYSAITRNEFESVLLRWMNLEPVTKNEASQKNKCHINIYIPFSSGSHFVRTLQHDQSILCGPTQHGS